MLYQAFYMASGVLVAQVKEGWRMHDSPTHFGTAQRKTGEDRLLNNPIKFRQHKKSKMSKFFTNRTKMKVIITR